MRAIAGVVALAGLGGLVFVVLRMSAEGPGESVAGQAIREDLGLPPPPPKVDKRGQETVRRGDEQEIYTPTEREVLQRLVDLGRARWERHGDWLRLGDFMGVTRLVGEWDESGTPIRATELSTAADLELLAEVECRRAVDHYGMPSGQLSSCIRTLPTVRDPNDPKEVMFGRHWWAQYEYSLPGGQKWLVGL